MPCGRFWGRGGICPFCPPLGSDTVSDLSFVTIILKKTARNMHEEVLGS